jgi:hypothetical protein
MTWLSFPPDTRLVADAVGERFDFVIDAVPDEFQLTVCDMDVEQCNVTVHETVEAAKAFAEVSLRNGHRIGSPIGSFRTLGAGDLHRGVSSLHGLSLSSTARTRWRG